MNNNYVDHFTVGWNGANKLVPIPVLRQEGNTYMSWRIESDRQICERLNCTILLLDYEKYGLNEFGYKLFVLWRVISGKVKCDSRLGAEMAIQHIMRTEKLTGGEDIWAE